VNQNLALIDHFQLRFLGLTHIPRRMMGPIIEELSTEMEGKAKIAKLDIETSQKTTSNFNVTSIPTIILFIVNVNTKKLSHVIHIARLRGNRVLYRQPLPLEGARKRGRPKIYGEVFRLSDPPVPDQAEKFSNITIKRKGSMYTSLSLV